MRTTTGSIQKRFRHAPLGGVYIIHTFEANIVDYVVAIDRGRWLDLIYDTASRYAIIMSFVALFKCAFSYSITAKIERLYGVVKLRLKQGRDMLSPFYLMDWSNISSLLGGQSILVPKFASLACGGRVLYYIRR